MGDRTAISQTFYGIAQKMKTDFESSKVQLAHRGLRGRAREASLVTEFLGKYLPRNVQVRRNGEIVSTAGDVSTECDVIICDFATPPLWTQDDVDVVPVECVYVVIEVKSRLDLPTLRETWNKAAAIKAFPKTAYLSRESPDPMGRVVRVYDADWRYFPVHAYVFAFESVAVDRIAGEMCELANDTPLAQRLDGVWTLDHGSVLWHDTKGGWSPAETDPIEAQFIQTYGGESPLPLMAMQLQGLLQTAFTPPFRIGDYMGNLILGTKGVVGWVPDKEC